MVALDSGQAAHGTDDRDQASRCNACLPVTLRHEQVHVHAVRDHAQKRLGEPLVVYEGLANHLAHRYDPGEQGMGKPRERAVRHPVDRGHMRNAKLARYFLAKEGALPILNVDEIRMVLPQELEKL